jgi:glycosyltransferase involved in cell wall biosynthesis
MSIQRALILGDSPRLKTGFGKVNRIAADLFQKQGWEVAAVAGLTTEAPSTDDGIKTYVPSRPGDVLGLYEIERAVEEFKPDIAFFTADLGTAVALTSVTPGSVAGFGYIPIEGGPVANQHWQLVCKALPMMTCSKYGADLIQEQFGRTIDWAYHGIDHNVYKPNPKARDDTRSLFKWTDKFVINMTANNVRRKQIPRLIEAVAILKHKYKQKDIVLYLHTVPFQNYWLEGHNLDEITRMYDVWDEVKFHPAMNQYQSYIPETSPVKGFPGLAEMYNASDLFVLPSQVEGFGLPIAEAMATGLPVLVTKYAAGYEVASPAGRGIPVKDWEVHKSGTLYGNVSPVDLANEILRLKRNPKERQRMSEAGLRRAADFTWDDFESKLIPALEATYDAHKTWSAENEGTDTVNEEARQEEDAS